MRQTQTRLGVYGLGNFSGFDVLQLSRGSNDRFLGLVQFAKVKTNTSLALIGLLALFSIVAADAADLHPIIEIETGYFFGVSANGKWIKPEQAAKLVTNETSYRFTA
jgi:hypothetical protein